MRLSAGMTVKLMMLTIGQSLRPATHSRGISCTLVSVVPTLKENRLRTYILACLQHNAQPLPIESFHARNEQHRVHERANCLIKRELCRCVPDVQSAFLLGLFQRLIGVLFPSDLLVGAWLFRGEFLFKELLP